MVNKGIKNYRYIIWDLLKIVIKIWAYVEVNILELQYLEKWLKVTRNGPTVWNKV